MPIRFEAVSNHFGTAVDWINQKVYYCEGNRLMEDNMLNENPTPLLTADTACDDLVIDPFTG